LERRGLFDFVSPFVVFLTMLCYPLLVGLVIYEERDDGFAEGLVKIGAITLMYATFAFGVYASLYGKRNPFQTHEDRIRAMAISVKGSVYTCLVAVVYISLHFLLTMLGLPSWKPFAMSAFLVICGVSSFWSILNAIPRELKLDGLRPAVPETRSANSPG
jgi:NADH:ubiquinone oxidoreductase subunit 4 (subunit M)